MGKGMHVSPFCYLGALLAPAECVRRKNEGIIAKELAMMPCFFELTSSNYRFKNSKFKIDFVELRFIIQNSKFKIILSFLDR